MRGPARWETCPTNGLEIRATGSGLDGLRTHPTGRVQVAGRQGDGQECPSSGSGQIAGAYIYRRVYHDDRRMELLPSGLIGEGAAGRERLWGLRGTQLEILGDEGVTCQLKQDGDGVWRGNWIHQERMPIELYPLGADIPPMPRGWVTFRFPEITGFWWSNYECLGRAVRKLCRQLPPLRAVAGIPRSGVIPASLIAQWQNIPLLDIDEALVSRPQLPTYRRRGATETDDRLPILIVDDTVSSGRSIRRVRLARLFSGKGPSSVRGASVMSTAAAGMSSISPRRRTPSMRSGFRMESVAR